MRKPRCLNQKCRRALDPGEDFCWLCGEDNREPSMRQAVRFCDHAWPHDRASYCFKCGAVRPGREQFVHSRRFPKWLGWVGNAFALGALVMIGQGLDPKSAIGVSDLGYALRTPTGFSSMNWGEGIGLAVLIPFGLVSIYQSIRARIHRFNRWRDEWSRFI